MLIDEPEENYKTGWIKTFRSLENHWIWNNPFYLKCWLWFLFKANHKDNKILLGAMFVDVVRGEFITSINNISLASGLTTQSTRTFLSLLEKDKMILKKSTNKLTMITICNYDSYQEQQQTSNKRVTNQQRTRNKPATTDKNEKNEKNEKNNIPTFNDFLAHALSKDELISERDVRLKYDSWVENDWKDGNDKKITNWKSKLTNSVKYFDRVKPSQKSTGKINPSDYDIPKADLFGYDPKVLIQKCVNGEYKRLI